MVFLQLALQREKAGRVGILRTSNVIFAYLFQILFTTDQGNSRNRMSENSTHRELTYSSRCRFFSSSYDGPTSE